MAPLTTVVSVWWRPTPKVYDCRISLLTFLEDRKLLEAFRVTDDVAHAMIADTAELSLTPRSISIGMSDGLIDSGVLGPIFEQVIEALHPRVTRVYGQFQHLIGLAESSNYDQARSRALKGIFDHLADDLSLVDGAILIDGSLGDPEATFVAEFGVVDKGEAAQRLPHTGGRIFSADEPEFSHIEWEDQALPEIGLYVDSRWHDHEEIPADINAEWLVKQAQRYRERANRLSSILFERTVFGQSQPR